MTILQLNDSYYLAILKINGTIYSAISNSQRAAHIAVMGVLYA